MASPGRLGDWLVNAALLGFFTPFVYMKLKNMQRKEEIIANLGDVHDILNKNLQDIVNKQRPTNESFDNNGEECSL